MGVGEGNTPKLKLAACLLQVSLAEEHRGSGLAEQLPSL